VEVKSDAVCEIVVGILDDGLRITEEKGWAKTWKLIEHVGNIIKSIPLNVRIYNSEVWEIDIQMLGRLWMALNASMIVDSVILRKVVIWVF